MSANLAGQTLPYRTDEFTLTDAIRPAPDTRIDLQEGFRVKVYRDRSLALRLPMLSASVSAERLFDVFLALLEPLGDVVHVVLESSHRTLGDRHKDYRRNRIDLPVLMSHFCEFEDLLLNDGCTGVAVLCGRKPMEVQFDEHKVLCVYAPSLKPFRRVLRDHGVLRHDTLPLISEVEHFHRSEPEHEDRFEELCRAIGVMDFQPASNEESCEY